MAWYYDVTDPDEAYGCQGPFNSEYDADSHREHYMMDNPDHSVTGVYEESDAYWRTRVPQAKISKGDGSTYTMFADGTIKGN